MPKHTTFESDLIPTAAGDLQLTFLGHGSLLFTYQGLQIYVDPYSQVADYSQLPPADLVLITHEHSDHLDPSVLAQICTEHTLRVWTAICAAQSGPVPGSTVLRNGDECILLGLRIQAVPAYNILHQRSNGQPFHPKGAGNGYILTFGDCRVYVAGDTENIPEMSELSGIHVAFLPMNLPYTMTPEMVASAARVFHPAILYPYHYGETKTAQLKERLQDEPGIEVRIRKLA
jgi:L-ascorbate metabolism protein UlaG (beta-lactamase superfamily)